MKTFIFRAALLLFPFWLMAQQDTIHHLEEVIIIGKTKDLNLRQSKPLGSVDNYLQQSGTVTMIKRGAYAWEPAINSMASERTLITIEGMHIFGACTDKMDPITSYVEISNLAEATVSSAQHGSGYGPTIAGAIDLKRSRTGLDVPGWKALANTGFETNSSQKIMGTALNYGSKAFYLDTDFMYRQAQNYTAGDGTEVLFSQFRKLNASATAGASLGKNKLLEASAIFDRATDVGYPALPMDVSLARALITSARLEIKPEAGIVRFWDTKLYYNQVTHKMDDTQRPAVPIHMDMPGWSTTYGGYSALKGKYRKHALGLTLNSYYNTAKAEMTMYPSDPQENLMYMLTWPDVHTFFSGFTAEDSYEFSCHSSLKVSAGLGYHSNTVASTMGLESLQIFYPGAEKTRARALKSVAVSYSNSKKIEFSLAGSYGERAPSVSEGYGFYLFNSFDNHDYIGNPLLGNEKAIEANSAIGYRSKASYLKLSASYFHIMDYIIGKPETAVLPMTIGADGVRRYTALPYATIANTSLRAEHAITQRLKGTAQLTYTLGRDNKGNNLPLMSPLRYSASLDYKAGRFNSAMALEGNAAQVDYSPEYGEDRTPAYAVIHLNAGYGFTMQSLKIHTAVGVENLLDTYYSTFGDWKNIPRKGRNFFLNLIVSY